MRVVNHATGVGLPKGTLEAAQPRVGEAPLTAAANDEHRARKQRRIYPIHKGRARRGAVRCLLRQGW